MQGELGLDGRDRGISLPFCARVGLVIETIKFKGEFKTLSIPTWKRHTGQLFLICDNADSGHRAPRRSESWC